MHSINILYASCHVCLFHQFPNWHCIVCLCMWWFQLNCWPVALCMDHWKVGSFILFCIIWIVLLINYMVIHLFIFTFYTFDVSTIQVHSIYVSRRQTRDWYSVISYNAYIPAMLDFVFPFLKFLFYINGLVCWPILICMNV